MTISWVTAQGDLGTVTEREITTKTVQATSNSASVTYSLIAGSLPKGLRLVGNVISGSPTEVKKYTTSRFVIRANDGTDIKDRTFSISVDGADIPQWITKEGYLQVGQGLAYFVLDNSQVNFQLESTDTDLTAGDKLEYYLMPMGGQLPPGLSLSTDGIISGYTDPIFAIDYNAALNSGYDTGSFDVSPIDFAEAQTNGFDSYFFDNVTYDYNEPSQSPKKLSRSYSFVVAVSDSIHVVSRSFKIYVVTEEFLQADNSLIQIGTNVFTADSSSDRVPLWITDSDLGRYRANNYLTLFLDVYDPPSLPGVITYFLLPSNPGTYKLNSTGEIITTGRYDVSGLLPEFKYVSKGLWKSTVNYNVGDAVLYSDDGSSIPELYVCQTAHINRTPIVGTFWNRNVTISTGKFKAANAASWTTIVAETASLPPPGLELDSTTGELAGTVPYQAKVSKSFKFTILAVNFPAELYDSTYTLKGGWNSGTAYQVNDAVAYLDLIYICTVANRNVIPTNENYWIKGVASIEKTFSIEIVGEIESAISWITDNNLGSIKPNQPSQLTVKAETMMYGGSVSYKIVDGLLPVGLEFLSTGTIQGKIKQFADADGPGLTRFYEKFDSDGPNSSTDDSTLIGRNFDCTWDGDTTTFDRKFTFVVEASDTVDFSRLEKTFYFTITTNNDKTFSNLYLKAFQSKAKRLEWSNFITDSNIFQPTEIYRYGDLNFGVQTELKMLVYAGIESTAAVSYIQAMSRNHYKKQIAFGNIKIASAKDPVSQEKIYEVVYVEIIDDLEKNLVSISNTVNLSDTIKSKVIVSYDAIKVDSDIPFVSDSDHQRVFPNSITNMRKRVKNIGERDRDFLPQWMRSIQDTSTYETGYVKALILCYALPGKAAGIVARIKSKTNYASRGEWLASISYQVSDSVEYKGNFYTCIKANINSLPDKQTETVQNWIENFNFKKINFTADRYLIDILDGEIEDKYLAFPQRGEKLP